jgi:hypothetical protein
MQGVNSTMIDCKNFGKYQNVPPVQQFLKKGYSPVCPTVTAHAARVQHGPMGDKLTTRA